MTKFISLEDFEGSSVSVDEKTIERANLYVERILAKLGVSSSLFPELKDNPHLKELARVYALYVTVIEYYTGDGNESEYNEKVKAYRELLKNLEDSITLKSLGLENPTTLGYASFPIRRG
jgi:uncharacterized membrane protein